MFLFSQGSTQKTPSWGTQHSILLSCLFLFLILNTLVMTPIANFIPLKENLGLSLTSSEIWWGSLYFA